MLLIHLVVAATSFGSPSFSDARDAARAVARGELLVTRVDEVADPWVTASLLRASGKLDLAMSLARATRKDERSALCRFIRSESGNVTEMLQLLTAMSRVLRASPARALEISESVDLTAEPVLAVCAIEMRIQALESLERLGGIQARIETAKIAHAIGWTSKRDHSLRHLVYKHLVENEPYWIDGSVLVSKMRTSKANERFVVYGTIGGETIGLVVGPHQAKFIPIGKTSQITELVSRTIETPTETNLGLLRKILVESLELGESEILDIVPQALFKLVPFSAINRRQTTLWPQSAHISWGNERAGGQPTRSIDVSNLRTLQGCRPVDLKRCLTSRDRYRAVYVRLELEGRLILHRDGAIHVQDFLSGCDTDLVAFGSDGSARFVRPADPARDALDVVLKALDDLEKGKVTPREMLKHTDVATAEFEKQMKDMQLGPQSLMSKSCPSFLVNVWTGGPEAAEQFLNRFHAHWVLGKPAPVCLANAQREMKATKEWSDPVYWAGWQVWGRR